MVSHDRHMLEMTADRLVLVDKGTAKDFDGSIEDYIAFVLAKDPGASQNGKANGGDKSSGNTGLNKRDQRRANAEAREKGQAMRKAAKLAEAELARLTSALSSIDRAMFDPSTAESSLANLNMSELMKRRGEAQKAVANAEEAWLAASEVLEEISA
jgi:ATP-binding cassette subfamily F protein 3